MGKLATARGVRDNNHALIISVATKASWALNMQNQECPLPAVAQALESSIKTRDEVSGIRQALQTYLQQQIENDNVPLTSTNLPLARIGDHHTVVPVHLTRIRKAYWKALQAHQKANARYDVLKVELEQLFPAEPPPHASKEAFGASQLAILYRREKLRKLKVIDRTLSTISSTDNAPFPVHSVDELGRRRAGEQPTPPSGGSMSHRDSHVAHRMLGLKKAVLSAYRNRENFASETRTARFNSLAQAGPDAEVAGLQRVLNELTIWMERQLSLITTEPETDHNKAAVNGLRDPVQPSSMAEIKGLYEQYLSSRRTLIDSVNNPPSPQSVPPMESYFDATNSAVQAKIAVTPAETLLPYVHPLATAKQEEIAWLQQSTFLRRQIAGAEGESARLISRLADESHLVQPGASSGKDWADASAEVAEATKKAVLRQVNSGEASAAAAAHTLLDVGRLPEILDGLDTHATKHMILQT